MSPKNTHFLPMVSQILAEIKKGPKGIALSEADTKKWAARMKGPIDPETSVHLLVLLKRFIDLKADRAAEQMFGLALLAMGEAAARDQLEKSGVAQERIDPLLKGAKAIVQLGQGLAPPSKSAGLAVGPRKKR